MFPELPVFPAWLPGAENDADERHGPGIVADHELCIIRQPSLTPVTVKEQFSGFPFTVRVKFQQGPAIPSSAANQLEVLQVAQV